MRRWGWIGWLGRARGQWGVGREGGGKGGGGMDM